MTVGIATSPSYPLAGRHPQSITRWCYRLQNERTIAWRSVQRAGIAQFRPCNILESLSPRHIIVAPAHKFQDKRQESTTYNEPFGLGVEYML